MPIVIHRDRSVDEYRRRASRPMAATGHGRRVLVGVVTVGALFGSGSAALAWWGAGPGTGGGTAKAASLNAPSGATATVASVNSVGLSWAAATLTTGVPASGYLVSRIRSSDGVTVAACGTASAPVSGTTCTDNGVPAGSYTYVVAAVYGTWTAAGAPTGTVTLVPDTTAPTVTVSAINPALNANGYAATSPVTVTLSATDGAGGSGVASVSYRVDGGTLIVTAGATATATVSGNGTHTVSYFATDAAGNSSTTATQTVKIDTVAPATPSKPDLATSSDTGSSGSDDVTADATPTFTGTAEAGATVTIYSGSTAVGSAVAAGGTYSVTTSALADGTYAITAKASDPAGNTSGASLSTTVTIDTTGPTATLTFPTGAVSGAAAWKAGCGTSGTDDICGTATDGGSGLDPTTPTTVSIQLGGGCQNGGGSQYNQSCPTFNSISSGTADSWRRTLPYRTGTFTVVVRVTDVAGNVRDTTFTAFTIS